MQRTQPAAPIQPVLLIGTLAALACRAATTETLPAGDPPLADAFAREVDVRLTVPAPEQLLYAARLSTLLAPKNLDAPQYVLLVDRSRFVQAALLYWYSGAEFLFVGASPVSTGKPGRFDYFTTPTGVFDHSLANPDFRAQGTRNEHGILGYGRKGMRIYDFGWQQGVQGWGDQHSGPLRFQMHATDPGLFQPLLGTTGSKGCVRIHASLNTFLDRHAVLDADYERALHDGQSLWVLRADREPTPTPGRYIVVVDSERTARPDWSPLPASLIAPKPAR